LSRNRNRSLAAYQAKKIKENQRKACRIQELKSLGDRANKFPKSSLMGHTLNEGKFTEWVSSLVVIKGPLNFSKI
jgi:hypothetical protein